MTSFHAELSPDFIEVFHLLGRELLGAAQHPGLVQKLRIKLYGLHLQIGVQQRIGIGQSTVVLQQHCVKVLHVLGNRFGNLHGGRSAVLCDRHASKSDDGFRHDGLGQRDARDGKAGGIYGMGMYHALDIRPLLIDSHVHLDFG